MENSNTKEVLQYLEKKDFVEGFTFAPVFRALNSSSPKLTQEQICIKCSVSISTLRRYTKMFKELDKKLIEWNKQKRAR